MDVQERVYMGKILIDILEDQSTKFSVYDEEWPEIIKRALMVQLRMRRFHAKHNEPPELMEQIDRLSKIVNKMLEAQSKRPQ